MDIAAAIIGGVSGVAITSETGPGTIVGGPTGALVAVATVETATQPIQQAMNVASTGATAMTTASEILQENTVLEVNVQINESNISLTSDMIISPETYYANSLTAIGWASNLAPISLILQGLAIANDFGKLPGPPSELHIDRDIPIYVPKFLIDD